MFSRDGLEILAVEELCAALSGTVAPGGVLPAGAFGATALDFTSCVLPADDLEVPGVEVLCTALGGSVALEVLSAGAAVLAFLDFVDFVAVHNIFS